MKRNLPLHTLRRPMAALVACACVALPFVAAAQERRGPPPQERHGSPPPRHGEGPERRVGPNEWWDGRYGHGHAYPVPGRVVPRPPGHAEIVVRGGTRYWFHDGVWYAPRGGAYVVARPPHGVVIGALPLFATVVTIGALTYYYANDVYYRPLPAGGYEVVDPPAEAPAAPMTTQRAYVYPRQGQSPEQQADDEYACHRWAVGQTRYDPTLAATGQVPGGDAAARSEYDRARGACLDGRGYTVR